jgi:hypothetical protein
VAGKSPEEWVNQDVLVEISTGAVEYQVVARLDGINDWRIVWTMRLAPEEDLAAPPGYPGPERPPRLKGLKDQTYVRRP